MDTLKALDKLENLLKDSKGIPFIDTALIKREDITTAIEELRTSIPEDLRRAKYVSQERGKIIEDAEHEASLIIEEAKKSAEALVKQQEIYTRAEQEAKQVLRDAQEKHDTLIKEAEQFNAKMKSETWEYVIDMLGNVKEYFNTMSTELDGNIKEMENKNESNA